MINDFIKMKGELVLVLSNPEGNIKQSIIVPNLVVTAGKNYIADRMKNNTTAMSHMEVGTGTTSAAAGNTALVSVISSSRTALASTTVTDNAVAYVCNFGAGVGTGAVTEAGIFNASSGGTMLCRTVFSAINKGANDTLGITWTITVS